MKHVRILTLALASTLLTEAQEQGQGGPPARQAAPPARQAAPPARQAAPPARQAAPDGGELQRPIVRCGVGEIPEPVVSAEQEMKAFPAPQKGMARFVANLPKLNEEQDFKVEIIVGKTVDVDAANHHFFTGAIEAETIEGWGYTRYMVRQLGPMAGTLRARIGGPEKEQRFITLAGEPYLVRYNSRLPLVVYAPEDAEVKFRVWNAGERTIEMEKR